MTGPVLVTGGSGVVGSALVRHLVAGGVSPRALSRRPPADARLAELGAEPVRGDLLDEASLRRAMRGCELVFHAAGLNLMCPRHPASLTRTNVDGTLAVARAARREGVRRMVHTSSAAAVGEPRGTVGSERSPHRGWFLSWYERSKYLAERALLAVAEREGQEVVCVNPSSVQGPGRTGGTGGLVLRLLQGRLPFLIHTTVSVVDVDDCARGHLLAAERGVAGERYLLNSFSLPIREAVGLLEQALGRPLPVRYLPSSIASLAGGVVEAGAALLDRHPPLCREMVRTLRHGHLYDGSRAERELGLGYSTPEETLYRLVSWLRAEGLVSGG